MTVALVDNRIDSTVVSALESLGYHTIAMPKCARLSEAVASHPDMLMLMLGDTLLTEGGYLEEAGASFFELGRLIPRLKIKTISEIFEPEYPHDCLLNALIIGKYLFCRKKSLSDAVKEFANKRGLEIIDVKQGYPACTVLSVGNDRAITADRGMAKAMQKVGIKVLLIDDGEIELPPHEYGFIGGASGVDDNKVYFIGDLTTHPCGKEIADFCREASFEVISLGRGKLRDLGRIIFIDSDGNDKYGEKQYSCKSEERIADIH